VDADLVIQNLSKTYPGAVHALIDLSMKVKAGSITALLGPNGAGKTTLVECIAGLILPERGSIMYHGRDILKCPVQAQEQFAFLFEEVENVYGYLTVEENLSYFRYLNRTQFDSTLIHKYLKFLGLEAKLSTEAFHLSRGMKQKLAFLIALMKGTDFLILDEPTLGLDVQSRRQMITFLKELRDEREKTILLTTHDMGLAQEVSDYYFFINKGRLVWKGSRARLLELFNSGEFNLDQPLPLEQLFLHLTEFNDHA
jgi:ABC-2 type transport system ATP-binding protein